MILFRRIFPVLLISSLVLASVNVQASPTTSQTKCPMGMVMKDGVKCADMDKSQQVSGKSDPKKDCCGDKKCSSDCKSISAAASVYYLSKPASLSDYHVSISNFFYSEQVIISHTSLGQERPPKLS